jgi:hypothetical protein
LPLLLGDGSDPLAIGMHFSVICRQERLAERLDATLEANKSVLPEVRAAAEQQSLDYFAICQNWPSQGADPKGVTRRSATARRS